MDIAVVTMIIPLISLWRAMLLASMDIYEREVREDGTSAKSKRIAGSGSGEFIDFVNPEREFGLGGRSSLSLFLARGETMPRYSPPERRRWNIFLSAFIFWESHDSTNKLGLYFANGSLQLEERKEKPRETVLSSPLRPISFLRIYHKTLLHISRLSRDSNLIVEIAPFTMLNILFNRGRSVPLLLAYLW